LTFQQPVKPLSTPLADSTVNHLDNIDCTEWQTHTHTHTHTSHTLPQCVLNKWLRTTPHC